jgi:hypothetical protein
MGNTIRPIVFMLPLAVALVGCQPDAQLVKVQEFVKLASSGTEAFPTIANDFYGSCIRQADHPSLNLSGNISEVVLDEKEDIVKTDTSVEVPYFSKRRRDDESECHKNFKTTGTDLLKLNGLLTKYIAKLGQLSSGNVTDYSKEFGGLKASINQLNVSLKKANPKNPTGFDSEGTTAALSIFQFLFEAAARQYQKEQLILVIKQHDEDVQKLTKGLAKVVRQDYGQMLRFEKLQLDKYYEVPLIKFLKRAEEAKVKGKLKQRDDLPLTAILTDIKWREEKVQLDQRQELADAYVEVIESIADAHSKLKELLIGKQADKTPTALIEEQVRLLQPLIQRADTLAQQVTGDSEDAN